MKFFAACLFFTTTLFADSFILENKTSYKIAVEWASSARMVQESNDLLMQGESVALSKLYRPRQTKTTIAIPSNASYFRVLVWQVKKGAPDLLTNWVEIVPDKTYLLTEDHLTPVLLMNGMGC
jgi:hypothetical protein